MRDTDGDRASDEALLARYAAGDRVAARDLVQRLGPRAARYAARLLGGDMAEGEDVAQEALVRLWRAAPAWRGGEARVATWLYRVVTNLAIDRLRLRTRRPTVALPGDEDRGGGERGGAAGDALVDPAPLPEARLIAAERMAALDRALARLPGRQRSAVVLRHVEGLSNPEIAAVLGTGVEAVESLTARGRRALRLALAGPDGAFDAGAEAAPATTAPGRAAGAAPGKSRRMGERR